MIIETKNIDTTTLVSALESVRFGGFSNAETQYVFTQLFYEEGKTLSGTEAERTQKARDYVQEVLKDPFWADIGIDVDAIRFEELARAADAAQFEKNGAVLM